MAFETATIYGTIGLSAILIYLMLFVIQKYNKSFAGYGIIMTPNSFVSYDTLSVKLRYLGR